MVERVTIVGGGLAGCEAAWQLARRGVGVDLHEMRPLVPTPVHQTGELAELVCSNSLRGNALDQAAGLLKQEMRRLDSLVVRTADAVKVPAGSALAVDRGLFARRMTQAIEALPQVKLHRGEVASIPGDPVTIVATGPLTSERLAADVAAFVGQAHLHFFDAVSPVVDADSIDFDKAFRASRYGKGGDDYLNCPLDQAEYRAFHQALSSAECASVHDFEKELFFEGCLPVEVIASRGEDTLRFGPMKPVGLADPRSGRRPYAVVQLRQDNLAASHWSIVGFQTQLKWGEQKRVFQMIPGLERAEFVRFGMIHRNTYVNSPLTLEPDVRDAAPAGALLRRPDVGGRGLRGVGRVRPAGRPRRVLPRPRPRAARAAGGHGARCPRPLHRAERPQALPAFEHRLRAAAGAARARSRQGQEEARARRACAREPRRLPRAPGGGGCACRGRRRVSRRRGLTTRGNNHCQDSRD